MEYFHFEITPEQALKKHQSVCGDLIDSQRTTGGTTIMCCDGIGSGINARIAAKMATARLFELMKLGESVRQAFVSTAGAINRIRGGGFPYAAFCVAHILPDGHSTVYGYDMPPPLLITSQRVTLLEPARHEADDAEIAQTHFRMSPGDGLLLVSDGVTQSGMGCGISNGWGIEGALNFAQIHLNRNLDLQLLPQKLVQQAVTNWGNTSGDDCTAVLTRCRQGNILSIMTGPPADPRDDENEVLRFAAQLGKRAVCGATTGTVVARVTKKKMKTEQYSKNFSTPPRAKIEGIDLVTEGTITLNQVYNCLHEKFAQLDPDSPVSDLHQMIHNADRVNFFVGLAENAGNTDIGFIQNGILPRLKIVGLLASSLRALGKLVVVEKI